MFKKREALNRETHSNMKFEPNLGYTFAANEMLIPIVSGEVTSIARDYVIVFDKERPIPYAVLGVEKDVNAYVTEKGRWRGRYQPAFVRVYPFGLMRTPGQENVESDQVNYTIFIDPEAAQLRDWDGQPLFDADGKPTALLEKVQEVLTNLQKDSLRTEQMVRQLDACGLLVEQNIAVKKSETALTGFRVVDPNKLAELSGDEMVKLRDTGALMLIYSQMLSLSNLKDSPVASSVQADDKQQKGPSDKVKGLFADDGDFDLDFLH